MKNRRLIFLVLLTIVLISGCNQEELSCVKSGGEWVSFSDACSTDECKWVNNPSTGCIQVITPSCECGLDMCWNGKTCENI